MSTAAPSAASAPAASPEQKQQKFDLGIWYTLFNWPVLTSAVQNQWGGPDSLDKRDWLAGAISEVFTSNSSTDQEDVEIVLLQALEDEFDVRLEDETEVGVAKDIMKIKKEVMDEGIVEGGMVDELEKRWKERKGKEVSTGNVRVEEREETGDWDSVDEESEEDEDEEMEDAPPLAPAKPKEKPAPQIDEEGFEKVVGKKRR